MKNSVKWSAAGLLIVGIAFAAHFAIYSGVFASFQPGFAGHCSIVPAGGGSADIQLDRERGVAYLSIQDRTALRRGEAVDGTVMLLDLNVAEPTPRAAMSYDPAGFRPGGISLLKAGASPARLFALSDRAEGGRVVEIAEQESSGAFVPRETVTGATFAHAVAIAAVGSRQFYLADDASASGLLARWWSALRSSRASTILFHDGKQTRVVARDLGAPAGIGLSPDGTRLFVTDALDRQLHVYRRDAASNDLVVDESVPLGSTPGQLDVDADGVVWIAAHPRLGEFASHRRDPARSAATQLLRFDPRGKRPAAGESDSRVTQVYGNDGAQLSAGSSVARWRDEFLVGAPFDPKVLICKSNP